MANMESAWQFPVFVILFLTLPQRNPLNLMFAALDFSGTQPVFLEDVQLAVSRVITVSAHTARKIFVRI